VIRFFTQVFAVLRMPCKEHAALFSRELDEPLPSGTRFGLRVHVLYCSGCRAYRASLRTLRDAARSMIDLDSPSQGMPAEVRQRMEAVVRGAEGSGERK
jgi:hypothetical protein